MIDVEVPWWKRLRLQTLVLDVNGTLALDGDLLPGVTQRVRTLGDRLETVLLLSADTFGGLDRTADALSVSATRLEPGGNEASQKAAVVRSLGPDSVVAIGNGANDADMLREAALGICVLGPEGASPAAIQASDLLAASITEALDLLISPDAVGWGAATMTAGPLGLQRPEPWTAKARGRHDGFASRCLPAVASQRSAVIAFFCPDCWGEVEPGARECPGCGAALADLDGQSYERKLIAALAHPLPDRQMLAARILGQLRSQAARQRAGKSSGIQP